MQNLQNKTQERDINANIRKDIEKFRFWTIRQVQIINNNSSEYTPDFSSGYSDVMQIFRENSDFCCFLPTIIGVAKTALKAMWLFQHSDDSLKEGVIVDYEKGNIILLNEILCAPGGDPKVNPEFFYGNQSFLNEDLQVLFGLLDEKKAIGKFASYLTSFLSKSSVDRSAVDYVTGFLSGLKDISGYKVPTRRFSEANIQKAYEDGFTAFGKWDSFYRWSMLPPEPIASIYDDERRLKKVSVEEVLNVIGEISSDSNLLQRFSSDEREVFLHSLNYIGEWIKNEDKLLNPAILTDFLIYMAGGVSFIFSDIPYALRKKLPGKMTINEYIGMIFSCYPPIYKDLVYPVFTTGLSFFSRQIRQLFHLLDAMRMLRPENGFHEEENDDIFVCLSVFSVLASRLGLTGVKVLTKDSRILSVVNSFLTYVHNENHYRDYENMNPYKYYSLFFYNNPQRWNRFLRDAGFDKNNPYYCTKK